MSEAIYLYRRIPFADFSTCTIERFTELSAHHMYETKIAFDGDDYDTLRTANQRLEGEVRVLREALEYFVNRESPIQSKFDLYGPADIAAGMRVKFKQARAALAGAGGNENAS